MRAKVVKPGFYGKDGEIEVGKIVNVKAITSRKLEKYEEPEKGEDKEGNEGSSNTSEKTATTNPKA